MSRQQTPTTPKANNTTTTDHPTPTTTTNHIPSPPQAAPDPLSPTSATAPDFPRRSSSLHPRSPEPGAGAPLSSKNNDTSILQPEKGLGKESQGGNEEGVAGDGRGSGNGDCSGDGGGNGSGSGKNEMDDAKEKIEAFDWEGLEGRFWDRMEECRKVEEGVREEFGELVEVFNAWATAGSVGEEDRAAKRLRTRIKFVQQREESLEEKRLHYVRVVQAFESALALLSAA